MTQFVPRKTVGTLAATADNFAASRGEVVVDGKKAKGNNRYLFRTEDANGTIRTHFLLHNTVIASLEFLGFLGHGCRRVTLRDGGWPTSTTRKAFGEALALFGVKAGVSVGAGRPGKREFDNQVYFYGDGVGWKIGFDREVEFLA